MSSSIQSAVKSVIGGAGASDYVADVAGGLNQQVTQAGSNVIALKPVSAGQAGGRRRGSSRRRHSRQQKKVGGSAASHASAKKMEGGRRRTRRATSSRKNRK